MRFTSLQKQTDGRERGPQLQLLAAEETAGNGPRVVSRRAEFTENGFPFNSIRIHKNQPLSQCDKVLSFRFILINYCEVC